MAASPTRSPTPQRTAAEDPDTAAARKELRQTAISERPDHFAMAATNDAAPDASSKATTPDDAAEKQTSSPTKKRPHDDVDGSKDATDGADADVDVSPGGSVHSKKKSKAGPSIALSNDAATLSTGENDELSSNATGAQGNKAPANKSNTTTMSAFGASSMSSFASQPSPFLQASTGQTLSSFASPAPSQPPTAQSVFTTGSASLTGASPFGQFKSTTTFGGSIPGGFGSSLGGPQLTSFGAGGALGGGKSAKPFGTPSGGGGAGGPSSPSASSVSSTSDNDEDDEDKEKKKKPQPVAVDDGEAGEATIIQVRCKLFNLDKASKSWKERGAGYLKINVPEACVRSDNSEAPLTGSFDASALKNDESKVVRLLMRQDSTHRVILNTAIIPTMKFQEKSSLQATYLLFTAIENEGAVSIQIKMNAVNAKSFLKEVERVQLQLRSLTSPTDGPALTPPSKPSPDPHKGDKETVQSPGSS